MRDIPHTPILKRLEGTHGGRGGVLTLPRGGGDSRTVPHSAEPYRTESDKPRWRMPDADARRDVQRRTRLRTVAAGESASVILQKCNITKKLSIEGLLLVLAFWGLNYSSATGALCLVFCHLFAIRLGWEACMR